MVGTIDGLMPDGTVLVSIPASGLYRIPARSISAVGLDQTGCSSVSSGAPSSRSATGFQEFKTIVVGPVSAHWWRDKALGLEGCAGCGPQGADARPQ